MRAKINTLTHDNSRIILVWEYVWNREKKPNKKEYTRFGF